MSNIVSTVSTNHQVNNEQCSIDYVVQNNDFISHTVHRHELPVTDQRVRVIHEDEEVVVVDKPPSIPVHPCGRYRHNSILFILAKEEGFKNLHTVHRLDRLTSGVLIFSKTSAKARMMEQLIKAREVEKEYVCRVVGEFPEEEVMCEEPLEVISYKIGLVVVDSKGKECKTTFRRISYKDGVSVVRCLPKSGRMHQIRVHLQFLGFPIANDPLYNSPIFGPEKGKSGVIGKSREQLIEDLIAHHSVENWIESEEYLNSRVPSGQGEDEKEADENQNDDQEYFDPHCAECKVKYHSPPKDTLVMFLHALKYSGEGWSYSTELPSWATL